MDLKPYFNRKNDFTIVDNIIHRGHPGIERSKMKARSYIYCPNIYSDIKSLVQSCDKCAAVAKMPTKTLLLPRPKPSEPWQRLNIAGPIEGQYF